MCMDLFLNKLGTKMNSTLNYMLMSVIKTLFRIMGLSFYENCFIA